MLLPPRLRTHLQQNFCFAFVAPPVIEGVEKKVVVVVVAGCVVLVGSGEEISALTSFASTS